jgi:hypothetical protein
VVTIAEIPPVAAAPSLPQALRLAPYEVGAIGLPDGLAVLSIPAGASNVGIAVRVASVDPADVLPTGTATLNLTSRVIQITAVDDNTESVPAFDVPLALSVQPSADDLAAVGSDLWVLVLAVQDTDNGVWQLLPTTINTDGTLTAAVDRPAVYALFGVSALPVPEDDAPAL